MPRPPRLLGSGGRVCLDCVRVSQLAVSTVESPERNQVGAESELIRTLEPQRRDVADEVTAEVTERNRHGGYTDLRHVRVRVHRPTQYGVRLARHKRRLPQVLARGVLQLTNDLNRRVVHDVRRAGTVLRNNRVVKLDQYISADNRTGGWQTCGRTRTGRRGQRHSRSGVKPGRLRGTSPSNIRGVHSDTQHHASLRGNEPGNVEALIVQELVGHLNDGADLVGAERDGRERRVGRRQGATFSGPKGI